MDIDKPDIVAEVTAAFQAYERALAANDVAALDGFFLEAPTTVYLGTAENLYGAEEIAQFRAGRNPAGLERTLERTVVTAYGDDLAVVATLFRRARAPGKVGRELQTWLRTAVGWRIVAAHKSVIDDPATRPAGAADDERRIAPRFKTLKGIRIILPGGMSTIDCVARNRSETGLLIRLNGPVVLPPEFEVLMDNARRPVRVAWKKGLDIGVAYTD
jgi:ketosteroid isomerase-like protein